MFWKGKHFLLRMRHPYVVSRSKNIIMILITVKNTMNIECQKVNLSNAWIEKGMPYTTPGPR